MLKSGHISLTTNQSFGKIVAQSVVKLTQKLRVMDRSPNVCILSKTVHPHGLIFVHIFSCIDPSGILVSNGTLLKSVLGGVIIVALSLLVFYEQSQ